MEFGTSDMLYKKMHSCFVEYILVICYNFAVCSDSLEELILRLRQLSWARGV